MKITETFVADILKAEYPEDYQKIYDKRETIKERDWSRDKRRIMINANH